MKRGKASPTPAARGFGAAGRMTNAVIRELVLVRSVRRRNLGVMQRVIAYLMVLLLPAGAALAGADQGRVHALLIGVGAYLYLEEADLDGPGFDVALMAQVLVERGVAPGNITTLTTAPDVPDLPGGMVMGLPTRAAIIAGMERLVAEAAPGDTVLFYFSGHGSQAPDLDGDEMGGLDEIFLPMDARGWSGATGLVENAIIDDELREWVRALMARDIRFVGILDACHAGTGFRALGDADAPMGRARLVDPARLGIPAEVAPVTGGVVPAPLSGAFVFLYSAHSDQRSFEFPVDEGATRWHGSFTLALTQVLREAPRATWEQILFLTRGRMTRGLGAQDPGGEGPMLQATVFGAPGPARMAVAGGMVRAGLLHGLAAGAEVALFDRADAKAPLGHARIAGVEMMTATLAARDGAALPAGAAWAEVVTPAPPPPLRLAPARRADAQDGADYADWMAALEAVVAAGIAVQDAARPDLVPVLTGGVVALAGADGVVDADGPGASPRIALRAGEDALAATLRLIEAAAHSLRVRTVLDGMTGAAARFMAPPVTVAMTRAEGRLLADGTCAPETGPYLPHDPSHPLGECDALRLSVTNRSPRLQDLTVLYLDRDFVLTPVWPLDGRWNRLEPGQAAPPIDLWVPPGSTPVAKREELVIVALQTEPDAPRADLSALATPAGLRAAPAAAEDAAQAGFWATLDALMTPDAGTRSAALAGAARSPVTVIRQPVRLVPPPGG